MQFADFRHGARVFDDEDGRRIAQVVLAESGLQFFLYAADKKDPARSAAPSQANWGYVGAIAGRERCRCAMALCFMVALRGNEKNCDRICPIPAISATKRAIVCF